MLVRGAPKGPTDWFRCRIDPGIADAHQVRLGLKCELVEGGGGFWWGSEPLTLENHWEITGNILEIWWPRWGTFMVNVWKSYGQKLRSIILLRFGLKLFDLIIAKTKKPIISMICGFLDVSLSPKTNMIYLWRHQDTLTNPRNSQNIQKTLMWISKKGTSNILKTLEKTGTEHDEGPS